MKKEERERKMVEGRREVVVKIKTRAVVVSGKCMCGRVLVHPHLMSS